MTLGVVVGLVAEARLVGGLVEVGGGLPAGAEAAAERLVALGVTGLLSFGLAGGLDPALRPGRIVVPAAVLEAGQRYATNPALCGGVVSGVLLAGDAIIGTAAEKRRLHLATHAVAVDLESGAVARVAARHGLPFAVMRAICDPAERDLPPAALIALNSGGAIGLWRVAVSVLARPWQIPGLIALARDAAAARKALMRAAHTLGVG